MKNLTSKSLLLSLLALGSVSVMAQANGVYRWTDAQGRTHFSGQPPEALGAKTKDGKVQQLSGKKLGATPENLTAQRALDKDVQANSAEAKTRADAQLKQQARAEKERARDRECNLAGEAVRQYASGQRLAVVQPDGERKFLEDEEVVTRLADAKRRESEACAALPPDVETAPASAASASKANPSSSPNVKLVEGAPKVPAAPAGAVPSSQPSTIAK